MEIHDGGILRVAERCYIIVTVKRALGCIIQGDGMTISVKYTFERCVTVGFGFIKE